jgi:hypothetical protein
MSELPAQMDAFKQQQVRWVKGNMQVSRKLFGKLLRSDLPLGAKIMGVVHLTTLFVPYAAMVLTMLLTFPISLIAPKFLALFGWSMAGMLGPILMYSLAKTEFNPSLVKRWVMLPVMTLLGVGISVNCTWAILSGLSSKSGVFERTPKYNIQGEHEAWTQNRYALPISPITAIEILVGTYVIASSFYLYRFQRFPFPTWQLVSGLAYYMVAGASIVQSMQRAIFVAKAKEPESSVISN